MKLIDTIRQHGCRTVSIIGMSKNSGKTTTLNRLLQETKQQNMPPALLSYGRDGEEIDAVTLKNKPPIVVTHGQYFFTTEKNLAKSRLTDVDIVIKTDINTVLGNVALYRNRGADGKVELAGINSQNRVRRALDLLPDECRLILIDGALDRVSSATPGFSDGFILASGNALGGGIENIVAKTELTVRRLTTENLPLPDDRARLAQLIERGSCLIYNDAGMEELGNRPLFARKQPLPLNEKKRLKQLLIHGALTDRLTEQLLYRDRLRRCQFVVNDGSRLFINNRSYNLLENAGITVAALESMRLLAITVNPWSPYSAPLDSIMLIKKMRERIPQSMPIVDIMAEEYLQKYSHKECRRV